jgi:hypothetical protein
MTPVNHMACQETGAIVPVPVNTHKMIRGLWSIAPVKKKNSIQKHFIHFQLQNIAPICLQVPSNLGKIIPVALKYLIYAMQNSPCDLAPVKQHVFLPMCSETRTSKCQMEIIFLAITHHLQS